MAQMNCLKCKKSKSLTKYTREGDYLSAICDDCKSPAKAVASHSDIVTLAIGDLHTPFHHPDALPFLVAVRDKYKPDQVVFLGDEIDAHAISDWPTDPDGRSAGDELEEAIEALQGFYVEFPDAMICESNHTFRAAKKAYKVGLPQAFMKDIGDVLGAPKGWRWADHWIVDGVRFEHGESFGGQIGAFRTAMLNHQSTVIGHVHSFAGILYSSASAGENLFGMNVGCLIDDQTYAFKYAKFVKSRPWIGVALIDCGVPMLIPMKMDAHKRWTGKL